MGEPFADRDDQQPAQVGHFGEQGARGFFEIRPAFLGAGAKGALMAFQVRVGSRGPGHFRVGPVEGGGFDAEGVDFDAVAGAFTDGAAEFFEARAGVLAILRNDAGGDGLEEVHGEPEGVDSFVRQAVQVFLGVVVDIVGEFVLALGRAVDRPVKAARDTGADSRFAAEGAQRQERSATAQDFVLDPDQAAADPLGVGCTQFAGIGADFDTVFFGRGGGDPVRHEREGAIIWQTYGAQEVAEVGVRGVEPYAGIVEARLQTYAIGERYLVASGGALLPFDWLVVGRGPQVFDEGPILLIGLGRKRVEFERHVFTLTWKVGKSIRFLDFYPSLMTHFVMATVSFLDGEVYEAKARALFFRPGMMVILPFIMPL